MNGQQFTWLQGYISGKPADARAGEAAALAGFLAGCSQQGYKYSPAYYGCLVPYMPVCASSLNEYLTIHCILQMISLAVYT